MKTKNQIQGKKNRAAGGRFEIKVRKDLEKKWIVAKWPNNIEFGNTDTIDGKFQAVLWKDLTLQNGKHYPGPMGRLIPAKRKYNPFSKALSIGTGFPDFVCFINHTDQADCGGECFSVIFVEVKMNGYLKPEERAKCNWLLENRIVERILIASKDKLKRGKIVYKEYDTKE